MTNANETTKPAKLIESYFSTIPCGCTAAIAKRAYQGISFCPDKRADMVLKDTQRDIEALFNDMAGLITPENQEAAIDAFTAYVKRYRSKYDAYLYAKSRCMSVMICGGSGYNVAKENKKFDRERRLHELFIDWRSKAYLSMLKNVFGHYAVSGIITSDDPDALHLLRDKLERMERDQEEMKRINKAFRAFDKSKSMAEFFEAAGVEEKRQKNIAWMIANRYRAPYASFDLTSINNKIKAAKARIERLESYAQLTDKSLQVGDVEIFQNRGIMRVQIFFPYKPDAETIRQLKSKGFRWSPSSEAWQRQDTPDAHRAAVNIAHDYTNRNTPDRHQIA